jgi:predicted DNA-binding ribbon-helix-helix protein
MVSSIRKASELQLFDTLGLIHKEAAMNSTVKKRSIIIGSHKTSISLEDDFWARLRQIARERATTASKLIGMLDAERNGGNLSSTIRVFVLDHYRNKIANAEQRVLRTAEANGTVAAGPLAISGVILD